MIKRLQSILGLNKAFLAFIFIFSYFIVVKTRISVRSNINWYIFTPDGPIAQFCSAILVMLLVHITIKKVVTNQKAFLSASTYLKVGSISFVAYLTIANVSGLLLSTLFNTIDKNFNIRVLTLNNLGRIIDFVLFASLYLAYYHIKQVASYQTKLAQFNEELAQNKLQQIRNQLDPHFIFNSLNTLDELIEEDKSLASDYLNDFSDLYRIAINHSNKSLVPLQQEISFSQHYFNLMQMRLPAGFELTIDAANNLDNFVIPPFTLQLLVENALLHNQACVEVPIIIKIKISDSIIIENNIRALPLPRKGNGIGLKNLKLQYEAFSCEILKIEKSSSKFSITLPMLDNRNDL